MNFAKRAVMLGVAALFTSATAPATSYVLPPVYSTTSTDGAFLLVMAPKQFRSMYREAKLRSGGADKVARKGTPDVRLVESYPRNGVYAKNEAGRLLWATDDYWPEEKILGFVGDKGHFYLVKRDGARVVFNANGVVSTTPELTNASQRLWLDGESSIWALGGPNVAELQIQIRTVDGVDIGFDLRNGNRLWEDWAYPQVRDDRPPDSELLSRASRLTGALAVTGDQQELRALLAPRVLGPSRQLATAEAMMGSLDCWLEFVRNSPNLAVRARHIVSPHGALLRHEQEHKFDIYRVPRQWALQFLFGAYPGFRETPQYRGEQAFALYFDVETAKNLYGVMVLWRREGGEWRVTTLLSDFTASFPRGHRCSGPFPPPPPNFERTYREIRLRRPRPGQR